MRKEAIECFATAIAAALGVIAGLILGPVLIVVIDTLSRLW